MKKVEPAKMNKRCRNDSGVSEAVKKSRRCANDRDSTMLIDNQIEIERPVTIEEVAEFLQKSPETIRRYCRLKWKGFPCFKVGRNYMCLLSSVTVWCKRMEKEY